MPPPVEIAVLPLVEEEEAPPSLPSALPNAAAQLDDDNLPGGNPGFLSNLVDGAPPDDVAPVTATGVLGYDYGSGGTASSASSGAVLPADFSASVDPTGTVLTIHQISTNLDVLRVTLADTTSGAYTVTELSAIDHPAGDQENNLEFTINYQVTGAGGTVDGMLVVNVDDDTPNAVVIDTTAAAIVLDEYPVAPGGDGIVSATADFSVNFAAVTAFGTDGPGSVDLRSGARRHRRAVRPVRAGSYGHDGGDGDGIGQGKEILLNQERRHDHRPGRGEDLLHDASIRRTAR